MAFVQLIEYETSRPDDVQRVHEEWEQATKGKRSASRMLFTEHRDEPNRYCDIVFFESYDEAMANSKLPETQEYARKLNELVEGEPVYFNLDVVEEKALQTA